MADFTVCLNPPPKEFLDLQPCCLARDHKGRCRFWKQEQEGSGHGIRTYEIVSPDVEFNPTEYNRLAAEVRAGTKAKAIQFLDMKGAESSPEEVAALIQYLEFVGERK